MGPTTMHHHSLEESLDRLKPSHPPSSFVLSHSNLSNLSSQYITTQAVSGTKASAILTRLMDLSSQEGQIPDQLHQSVPTATSNKDNAPKTSGEVFNDEFVARPQSPVPSIERFLNSPELSASVESIKEALNHAALPINSTVGPLEGGSNDGQQRRRSFGDRPIQRRASVHTAASSAKSATSNASTQYSAYSNQSARVVAKLERRERAAAKRAGLPAFSTTRPQKGRQRCPQDNCDFFYTVLPQLHDHYRMSHDVALISCLTCNKAFRDEAACELHERLHRRVGHSQSYCTFCSRAFETSQNWQQHELQEHFGHRTWTCMLNGPYIPTEKGLCCAFCLLLEPTLSHLEDSHAFYACQSLPLSQRIFADESDFRHHLSMRHHSNPVNFDSTVREWVRYENIGRSLWRCGICGVVGMSQASRQEHISKHWKNGCTMENWIWATSEMIELSMEEYSEFMKLSEPERQNRIAELIPLQNLRSAAAKEDIEKKLPGSTSVDKSMAQDHLQCVLDTRTEQPPQPLGLFASMGRKFDSLFRRRKRRAGNGKDEIDFK